MGINITVTCASCKGEGSRIIGHDEQNQPIYENPCTGCGGDGKTTASVLDDTELNDILDKVTNIKNKVKDIKDETKDIKDVVDAIKAKVDTL